MKKIKLIWLLHIICITTFEILTLILWFQKTRLTFLFCLLCPLLVTHMFLGATPALQVLLSLYLLLLNHKDLKLLPMVLLSNLMSQYCVGSLRVFVMVYYQEGYLVWLSPFFMGYGWWAPSYLVVSCSYFLDAVFVWNVVLVLMFWMTAYYYLFPSTKTL